jgi:hypothetical protein
VKNAKKKAAPGYTFELVSLVGSPCVAIAPPSNMPGNTTKLHNTRSFAQLNLEKPGSIVISIDYSDLNKSSLSRQGEAAAKLD